MQDSDAEDPAHKRRPNPASSAASRIDLKKIIMACFALFFLTVAYECIFVDPEDRIIRPDFADKFLMWVESNPSWGLIAIALVIAGAVMTLVPIGTPLTIGCGYIYRGVYGWKVGLFVATIVSMAGSCLGAVISFLIGRYLMRQSVQQWAKKYPLFDAIDIAAKEHGLRIMAMLYLTPVMPLGIISYMCGTTSMNLYSFAVAKVFSFPLYLTQTFIGASAHALIKRGADSGAAPDNVSASDQAKEMEENVYLIGGGIALSLVMVTLVTRHIRKELLKILDSQKKEESVEKIPPVPLAPRTDNSSDLNLELGLTARRRGVKQEQAD